MYYFATHKDLYKPLLSRLVPSLTLGAGITIFMFLYDPSDYSRTPQPPVLTMT